jgi:hypothetical protein
MRQASAGAYGRSLLSKSTIETPGDSGRPRMCVLHSSVRQSEPEAREEVQPAWVVSLKQIDFPIALPFLELFFAAKRGGRGFVGLKPNQPLDLVSFGETGNEAVPVLPNSPPEVGSRADVKDPIGLLARDRRRTSILAAGMGPDLRRDGSVNRIDPIRSRRATAQRIP